jgi:arsenate reductase
VQDPAAVQGADDAKRRAFLKAFAELSTRINYLLALPIEKLDRLALKAKLDDIGTRTSAGDRDARASQGAEVRGPVS